MGDYEKRRYPAMLALVFLLLLLGCLAPRSDDGPGNLTVEVLNQNDEPVSEQAVVIRHKETNEQVFQDTQRRMRG